MRSGASWRLSGHPDDLVELFTSKIKAGDDNPETFYRRGSAFAQLARYPEAIVDYTEALSRFKPSLSRHHAHLYVVTLLERAACHTKCNHVEASKSDLEDAVTQCDSAVILYPDDQSEFLAVMVEAYSRMGETERANESAIRLDESFRRT